MSPKGGGLQELVLGTGWRTVGPMGLSGGVRGASRGAGAQGAAGAGRQRRAVQGPVLPHAL